MQSERAQGLIEQKACGLTLLLNRGYIYILITETAKVAEIAGRDRQDQNGSRESYFSHVGFFFIYFLGQSMSAS